MSLASFHYAFTSRDELMAELVNTVVAGEADALAPTLQPSTARERPRTMRDAVRAGLQSYLDGVRADPDREKAMFELTQWALREPGFEALARRQYERYFELAESTLVAAAALTGCTWSVPAAQVARVLVMLTDGLTIAWLVTRDDAAATAAMDFAADAVSALSAPAVPRPEPHPAIPAPDTNAGIR